jgi:AcrR family transcriptional regulator
MLMIGEQALTQMTATAGLRAELLDATVRLLHRRDVAGLTTRDIAREAGCSAGALYRHFATRADLFVAVAQERLRPDFGEMVSRVGLSNVERNLERIILSTQRFMTELVPIVTAVGADAELRAGWGRAFERADIPPRRTVDAITAYIAAEQRVGRVSRQASPLMSASMLVGTCYEDALVQCIFGESTHGLSPTRHARALARELWMGLKPCLQNE